MSTAPYKDIVSVRTLSAFFSFTICIYYAPNHYFYAQNLSVKNGQNNGVLAGVPFLSPSRAPHALAREKIPPSPSPFNAGHAG